MKVRNAAAVPAREPRGHHREGGIAFTPLHQGEPGTPGYFTMMLVRFSDYTTPRHRHNYEQIRFCLSGATPYTAHKEIPEGWVGYFPEGTWYGPQNIRTSLRDSPVVLAFQFGGPSFQGFHPGGELGPAYEALAATGRFEHGNYHWTDAEGREHMRDGYEAAWSHLTGRELVYPPARYAEPVLMDPDAFGWFARGGEPGVAERVLGRFGERGTEIAFRRLDDGAATGLGTPGAPVCVYVRTGAVRIGDERHGSDTAVHVPAGETAVLAGEGAAELFVVTLPDLTSPPLRRPPP
jgi:hypothetical protein